MVAVALIMAAPVGPAQAVTYTATLDPAATGALVNTATVAVPISVAERDPADNTAADTDTVTPPLFADGFDSGTTSAWSAVVPKPASRARSRPRGPGEERALLGDGPVGI